MLVAQSCIVADPPEYRDPGQTRPLLDTYGASPPTTRILVVDSAIKNPIQFNVPVQSEDVGEDLRAIFFLDYGSARQSKLLGRTIPASTYENKTRAAELPWLPIVPMDVAPGCHFVTLVVAHESSFLSSNDERLDPTKAPDDASLLTWTVNIDPSPDAPNTLVNCPSSAVAGGS